MIKRTLGRDGPLVSAIGLGCMGMSGVYGPADRQESLATLRAALDAGVTLLDTGDFYGLGHNEMLIAEAVREVPRDSYQVSVKFGTLPDARGRWAGFDSRPKLIRAFIGYTLQRLGLDHIDIYRPSRLDPDVPIEDTIGTIAELVTAGMVRHIGISELGEASIRRAAAVHPICDLQIEYSLLARGIESTILPTCRELGIGITAYGVLARGLMGGQWSKGSARPGDVRAMMPRFQDGNVDSNLALVESLRRIAAAKGVSVAQVAIAWVASRGDDIVPLVGARRRDQLSDAVGALAVKLTDEDLSAIEAAVPAGAVAGERYPEMVMRTLDSEKADGAGQPMGGRG